MASKTTQRSLKALREQGYLCEIVEHWIPFQNRRKDLFGVIDILAINDEETLGVQTTTHQHVGERVEKILSSSKVLAWLGHSGRKLVVHGWRKPNKTTRRRWECTVVNIVPDYD